MFRYRKTARLYKPEKMTECPFCAAYDDRLIHKSKHTSIIRNIYPYDIWEYRDVTDHLLLIPHRHVSSLDMLSAEEREDYVNVLAMYEAKNYNVYTRSHTSTQKTVPAHMHTHLIATKDNPARFLLFTKKPYWLIKR